MMSLLAADQSRITFEGHLAGTGLLELDGASNQETRLLKRATAAPRLDYVILPLTPDRVAVIERAIKSRVGFKGDTGIIHVQIEAGGEIAFAAYDRFHPECVVVNAMVPISILDQLVKTNILRGYRPVAKRK